MIVENYYDIENIKKIWRQYQTEFGRLYPNYVEDQCTLNRFFCCKINGIVAGIASYDIKNTKRVVVVDVIATLPEFRGKGVAKALLRKIYEETESLYKTLGFRMKIEAYLGLPNNEFWDYMSYDKEYHESPSGKTKSIYYYIDLHKLENM